MLLTDVIRTSWEEIGMPQHVLAAFSGGADSTALLIALHRFSLNNGGIPRITAHHVHHGLRKNADRDAAFCEKLCRQLSISYSCTQIHLTGSSENEARTKRYEALFAAADAADARTIVLAHHQHDQTETMLMRLMRGTASGLKGMSPFSRHDNGVCLWRPFLNCAPDTLKKALTENRIHWQEDESNREVHYLRNLLRNEVLPLMRNVSPRMDEHFYQTSVTLWQEGAYLDSLADDFLKNHACTLPPCPFLEAKAFSKLHPAMKKRVLHTFFQSSTRFTKSPDWHVYDSSAALLPGETVNLPDDCRLFHAGVHIHLMLPNATAELSELTVLPYKSGCSNGIAVQSIPKYVYEGTVLRTWQPGDYITPFGMDGTKSLQDYLTDKKVDRPFRKHLPLLCKGQEVLWVIGVGASEKMRALPDDEMNLLLCYPGRSIMHKSQYFPLQDNSTKEY